MFKGKFVGWQLLLAKIKTRSVFVVLIGSEKCYVNKANGPSEGKETLNFSKLVAMK